MKKLGKVLLFLLSTVLRCLPFVIFALTDLFWRIYNFQLDPIRLLNPSEIPAALADFLWLYIGLGLMILVFLTLRFPFLAYSIFLAAWGGQNLYFLREWDNAVYHMNLPSRLSLWLALIFIGLLVGFLLQTAYTGGRRYHKIARYNRLRRISQEMERPASPSSPKKNARRA
ncbi:hypothetical protein ABB02_01129 [Clostridiaceae bacterium JG1575]|nr:hypothetical protein ABB02_01129 [Clostridiaceae bacterium JG1575]